MLGQIVEIAGEGRRLSLARGFLEVSGPEGRIGQAPLDDIEAVIFSNPAASLTTQAIAALAARGPPLVICGPDFRPVGYLLPVDGHHAQGDRVEAQAAASLPVRKRLWAELARAKILAQAAALERTGGDPTSLRAMASRVRSGDPANLEAQAAQRYFPALFGPSFRRQRDVDGANALLNYGYTVLRAATARAVVGAGLHRRFRCIIAARAMRCDWSTTSWSRSARRSISPSMPWWAKAPNGWTRAPSAGWRSPFTPISPPTKASRRFRPSCRGGGLARAGLPREGKSSFADFANPDQTVGGRRPTIDDR